MSDTLIDFTDEERADLEIAAGRMALHWKRQGLTDAVRLIGREEGIAGARALLGAYFELRQMRLDLARRKNDLEDDIPF